MEPIKRRLKICNDDDDDDDNSSLVRVQCRRKESSRSLSHLLMSFLFYDSAMP